MAGLLTVLTVSQRQTLPTFAPGVNDACVASRSVAVTRAASRDSLGRGKLSMA